MSNVYDLIIVGAGPVGLYAAFCAGLRSLSVAVIDSMPVPGGQVAAFYPNQLIYDVPSQPGRRAQDVVDELGKQASLARPEFFFNETVADLRNNGDGTFSVLGRHQSFQTRTILLAIGVGALTAKHPPFSCPPAPIVSYTLVDPRQYAGKHVAIWGTGEWVAGWLTALQLLAKSITLIQHRPFMAVTDNVHQLSHHEVSEVQAGQLVVRDITAGTTHPLPVDHLLINLGIESDLSPLANWHIALDGNAIGVDQSMQTSRPGIFAAGDICSYPGKLKLIATGFAEAYTAVNHICCRIHPDQRLFPGHSTTVASRRLAGLSSSPKRI